MDIYFCGKLFREPFWDETKQIPEDPGVYVVLESRLKPSEAGDYWRILDVGQAENLSSELRDHERRPCWINNCKMGTPYISFRLTAGSTEEERETYVTEIRDAYNPPCGERYRDEKGNRGG